MPRAYVNPNYPTYESDDKEEESLDLAPITDALESLKRAVMSNKAKDSVEVTNFDEVRLALRKELGVLADKIKPLIENIDIPEPPKEIKVSNFPEPVKHPDSVKVNNLDELANLLGELIEKVGGINVNPIVNLPAPIVNVPEQPAPVVNIPQSLPPLVDINIEALLSALQPLRLLSRDPNKPITVRMSDGRHFIDALTQTLKDNGERLATVVSTSYGLTKDEYKAACVDIEDPTRNYKCADVDADASPNYYGFIDAFGKWYILKETISTGADTYRYVKGSSGYTTAWTNRATQTYDYFSEVF
jgi:hypothetical protein